MLDAASNGASQGISLILNIIANLVAFVAFIAFADEMLQWLTYLVGFEDVGIQYILGKIFIPISWAVIIIYHGNMQNIFKDFHLKLGVDWEDCEAVGNIIGTKTIINEFVAYRLLGEYKSAGEISVAFDISGLTFVQKYKFIYLIFLTASVLCYCNLRHLWLCEP